MIIFIHQQVICTIKQNKQI